MCEFEGEEQEEEAVDPQFEALGLEGKEGLLGVHVLSLRGTFRKRVRAIHWDWVVMGYPRGLAARFGDRVGRPSG